jgi:thioredoxin reductase
MSAASARRLKRLEEATAPRDLGQYHCIYACDAADYERQKAVLIASGRAKATDLIFDANWRSWQQRGSSEASPEYVGEVREPETLPWTMTHDERVLAWSRERAAQ